MTNKDYIKFNQLFLYYSSCSVHYTTEYSRWRDAGNKFDDEHSEELKRRGDRLDEAGEAVRNFVKSFVTEE